MLNKRKRSFYKGFTPCPVLIIRTYDTNDISDAMNTASIHGQIRQQSTHITQAP